MPETIADRTRRVYDRVATFYPLSTFFFHSKAHRCALREAGIEDGMRILEVATGSGEMFRRIVRSNQAGRTIGVDLSPNMAALAQRRVQREFPSAQASCKAVDARRMPFGDHSFDAVICCYLLELLGQQDVIRTLEEMRRVVTNSGSITLILIGQNAEAFNRIYTVLGRMVPAFWGRQVEQRLPLLMEAARLRIVRDQTVRQTFYPSRVVVARKHL